MLVDDDGSLDSELQLCIICEGGVRTHPESHDDEVCFQPGSALQDNGKAVSGLHGFEGVGKVQVNAVRTEVEVHVCGHLAVYRGKHLVRALDDRYLDSHVDEVLRHFQPDVSRSADDGLLGLLLDDEIPHREGVLDRPEAEDARVIQPGKARAHGFRAGSEDELVVFL